MQSLFARGLRPENVDLKRAERLVFVCKGNICRSAYAGALAHGQGLAVASCGLDTTPGLPADAVAQRIAAGRGIDLAAHRTQRWLETELTGADLVLAMEPGQLRRIAKRVADVRGQVGLLGLWSMPPLRAIKDPYGQADARFEACFDLIEAAVARLATALAAARLRA